MKKSRRSDTTYSKATSSTNPAEGLINGNDGEDEIEVEVANLSLRVSRDAWKSYQAYKQYEDWSNETEKTDYTYSRLSNYRGKEIIPGLPVRPNLCRSPIRSVSSSESFTLNHAEVAMQNRHNYSTYRNSRNFIEEDNVDNIEINDEYSLYQRILQSFVAVWAVFTSAAFSCVEKTQSFVQQFSTLLAGSFVYIWTKTAAFISLISFSVLQLWHRILRRNEASEDVSPPETETDNIFTILIIRRVLTIVTTISTIYHKAISSNVSSSNKYKYLWLLLLPLLFLAALTTLYYYSINPATIVLSLIVKTYYIIIESPYYFYNCILATPNTLHYLIFNSFPHFFMKAIPNFFTQSLPQFFYLILSFFTLTLPQFLYSIINFFTQSLLQLFNSILNLLSVDLSFLFSFFEFHYCIESAYNFLLNFFANFAIYTHFVYSWLGSSILYVFSLILLPLTWIYNNFILGGSIIYDTLLNCLNFTNVSDHTEVVSNFKENNFLNEN